MNILVPDSWLREYLKTNATPKDIKRCLSLCGPSIEKIEKKGSDFIYDIEITTNRIDCVSVYGIAREAAVILPGFGFSAALKDIPLEKLKGESQALPLEIIDKSMLCDRLLGIVLDNVKLGKSSDLVVNRLEKAGVRALNNVIDVTNYVMIELGHPCHVFDYDRIKTNKLVLRKAKKGEVLVTLDDKKCILKSEDIVIDDGTGRIIDLPGIIGTKNSVVTAKTKRVVLFIESNNPVAIRKTSIHLGVRTLAATINEKHPDPILAKTTILKAIELVKKATGAKEASKLIDIFSKKEKAKKVISTRDFINSRMGITLSEKEIINILQSLHFTVLKKDKNLLEITPPTFRQFDIEIPEDIVEEVARIYGYHNFPTNIMEGEIPISDIPKDLKLENEVKNMLKYFGFTETYHYSFVSKKLLEKAGMNSKNHLRLANPLTEDTEFMRTSLIPPMLETIEQNQHYQPLLSLFELAKIYLPVKRNLPKEESYLLMAVQSSFFELKGMVIKLLEILGIEYKEKIPEKNSRAFFHPKQTIMFLANNEILAKIGLLHPEYKKRFSLEKELYLAEINFDLLVRFSKPVIKYSPISPYPEAFENLALKIPQKVKLGQVIKDIYKLDKRVKKVELIDQFKNTKTLKITYHDSRKNITSEEIREVRKKILIYLEKNYNIHLKK